MIIPIRRDANGVAEWAMIELHGDLKESPEFKTKIHIGDLCYNKSGTATLIIGNHILSGKETSMDKPIAVLEKKIHSENSTDNIDCDTDYTVIAIIRKKLLFKGRPKPITVNVPKSVK
ncbi:chromosome transmission fidelity protein 8 homolog [Belonocnema kinseyi]|uniref:chromosome transmission fidelity protein 8 homolog n=1 Tax=Belonocnema kinseyi TaxID=2817044 RepID=UPI00143D93BD|nr:chromosome transmission fidelity protein 8 homolog [Belonocnema kinseyi]